MDYSKKLREVLNEGYFPFPIQMDGINWMMTHHYCILGDEPGVGKTIQAISTIALAGGKAICVVPSSLKVNWKDEFEKFSTLEADIIATGVDARKCNFNKDIIICSYGLFAKLPYKVLSQAKTIAFDEAHYLCNPEAQRTQVAHEIIETHLPERVLLLSGTPVKNRVGEYFSLLAMCSYNPKGTSGADLSETYSDFYKFQETFSYKEEFSINRRKITRFEGTRNIPLLKTLLRGKYKRRTLDQVAEIPEMMHIPVSLDMKMHDEEMYEEFLKGESSVSGNKAKSALAKADSTGDYVNDLLKTVDAVIVFTDHVQSAIDISKRIKGSECITGSTSTDKRAALVKRLQSGSIDCLVCTIGSMSTGHTLTRARDVVFNDLSWVEADNEQARRRIRRVSQKAKTRAHYMEGSKVCKMIRKTLSRKINNLKEIV